MDGSRLGISQSRGENPSKKRVILLIDMDCFYVQVEQRFCPETKGKPCAVVQYKSFQGGTIIAVSYEARKFGVRRVPIMNGNEAKRLCPDIHLFQIPEKRGKANLDKYRESCKDVMNVFLQKVPTLERASVDEAFLDITDIVHERLSAMDTWDEQHILQLLLHDTLIAHYDPSTPFSPSLAPPCTTEPSSCVGDVCFEDFDDETDSNSKELTCPRGGTLQGNEEHDVFCEETEEEPEPDLLGEDCAGEEEEEQWEDKEEVVDVESSQEKRKEGLRLWLSREGRCADLHLVMGAVVAQELRRAVYDELGFTCSAGISYNKVLAKLAAGMNKPNGQTVLPSSSVKKTFDGTPIKKVRSFGGKFGLQVQKALDIENMGELRKFSSTELADRFGKKSGLWLYNICRGVDDEPLRVRHLIKSIGCGKNFRGPEKLKSQHQVQKWLLNFAEECMERMQTDRSENHRVPSLMSVHVLQHSKDPHSSFSRSSPFAAASSSAERLAGDAWKALCRPSAHTRTKEHSVEWLSGVVCMNLSLSKFQPLGTNSEGGGGSGPTLHSFFPSRESLLLKRSAAILSTTNPGMSVLPRGEGVPASAKSNDATSPCTQDAKLLSKGKSLLQVTKTKRSSVAVTGNAKHAPTLPQSPVTRVARGDVKHKESSKQNRQSSSSIHSFFLKRPLGGTIDITGTEVIGAPVVGTPPSNMQRLLAGSTGGVSNKSGAEPAPPVPPQDVHQILDASGVCPDVYNTLPQEIQEEVLQNVIRYGGKDLGVLTERMCEICGERIRVCDEQVHKDHHIALQLSQSLRQDTKTSDNCSKNEQTSCATEEHVDLGRRHSLAIFDSSSSSSTVEGVQGICSLDSCSTATAKPNKSSDNRDGYAYSWGDSVVITDSTKPEYDDSNDGHTCSGCERAPNRSLITDSLLTELTPQSSPVASGQIPVLSSKDQPRGASLKRTSSIGGPLLDRKRSPGSNNLEHYRKRRMN